MTVSDAMIEAAKWRIWDRALELELPLVQADAEELAKAAMQPTQQVPDDVERLLREARPYVEQAGFRHHDVSGLLAEIDAALAMPQPDNEVEG